MGKRGNPGQSSGLSRRLSRVENLDIRFRQYNCCGRFKWQSTDFVRADLCRVRSYYRANTNVYRLVIDLQSNVFDFPRQKCKITSSAGEHASWITYNKVHLFGNTPPVRFRCVRCRLFDGSQWIIICVCVGFCFPGAFFAARLKRDFPLFPTNNVRSFER